MIILERNDCEQSKIIETCFKGHIAHLQFNGFQESSTAPYIQSPDQRKTIDDLVLATNKKNCEEFKNSFSQFLAS